MRQEAAVVVQKKAALEPAEAVVRTRRSAATAAGSYLTRNRPGSLTQAPFGHLFTSRNRALARMFDEEYWWGGYRIILKTGDADSNQRFTVCIAVYSTAGGEDDLDEDEPPPLIEVQNDLDEHEPPPLI